jgi:hypothetical protein
VLHRIQNLKNQDVVYLSGDQQLYINLFLERKVLASPGSVHGTAIAQVVLLHLLQPYD